MKHPDIICTRWSCRTRHTSVSSVLQMYQDFEFLPRPPERWWVYEGVAHHVLLDWMCNQAVNPKVPCQRSGSAGSLALQSVCGFLQAPGFLQREAEAFLQACPRCPGPSCTCRGLVRLSELSDGLGFKLQSEASGKRAAASGRLLSHSPSPPDIQTA